MLAFLFSGLMRSRELIQTILMKNNEKNCITRKHFRLVVYILCMAAAFVLTIGLFVYNVIFPLPDRYASSHPASTVPPLMGFSDDSVFNTGDAKALDAFPGIGEVLSQRIVEGRSILGDYRLPTDLLLVKGIGPKTLDKMMGALTEPLVPLDSWDE